ncbi:DUF3618 domain-containing protein [Actinomadura sp. NTSP31]|uniref:DUF3618 domain-containing protein n=1 Tax=Actinomadura sp. NTSP31 TaxID=1735447 RepID=UPI0035BEFC21
MADRDPEALEREIERTRRELARTIDELAERVNPKNLAHKGSERIKEEAGQLVQAVNAMVRPEGEDGEPGRLDKRVVYAGAAAAVTLTAYVLWRRKRKRR